MSKNAKRRITPKNATVRATFDASLVDLVLDVRGPVKTPDKKKRGNQTRADGNTNSATSAATPMNTPTKNTCLDVIVDSLVSDFKSPRS
jgi:hypothetical protein